MMDIGATLRNARERKGISLESLARITRIKPDLLRAMEDNAFQRVPGGIFRRGFLRSYAREVGLDPEIVVQSYLEEFEAEPPAPLSTPPPDRILNNSRSWPATPVAAWLRPRATAQWAAVAGIVGMFSVYSIVTPKIGTGNARQPTQAAALSPAKADAQPAAAPTPTPVGTMGGALQIDIAPIGPCWISATADGQQIAYGLFQPGDRRTIRVQDGLVLRVGDPAAFAYKINGVPGRPLGPAAAPVSVTIAPGNFREFLAAAQTGRPEGLHYD